MTPPAAEPNAQPLRGATKRFLPNLSAWIWVILFLLLIVEPQHTRLVSSDGDANMHWRVGEFMLQTRQIIHTDAFSHTMSGAPIISKEWLSQILFALAGRVGGLTGLAVLAAIVIASTFALLHRQLVREGNDLLMATLLVLIAVWASIPHWHARPHIFSLLMLLLWHQAILRFERQGGDGRLALSLGVLTMFWVNLHGGYLAGFIVLGGYWLAALFQFKSPDARRKLIALTWVGVVCASVSLLNPNGYHLHVHNLHVVGSGYVVNWFNEYSSNNFHELNSLGFLIWLAIVFGALVLCRPSLPVGAWIVLIVWGYFALYAARNVSLFVILAAPIITPVLSEVVRADAMKYFRTMSDRITHVDRFNRGWVTVPVIAITAVLTVSPMTSMPSQSWPVTAVEFIQKNPDQFRGNMFNLYGWGGYLMRVLPAHKVFVPMLSAADARGEALMREYDELDELRPRWQSVLDKYDVRWTVLPAEHRLNLALALLPQWQSVYSDGVATIYLRSE